MPDWTVTEEGASVVVPSRQNLQEQLRAEQDTNLMLQESLADLELALEDVGWRRLADGVQDEFTAEGRRRVAAVCRLMAISNPLIKRALQLRIGYVWGQGVEITARLDEQGLQDQVNDLLAAFETDNESSLMGSQAQEELERAEGTDGEVFLALFTSPLTGRVQCRSTPADEIVDIIKNPEDRDEDWFFVREYTQTVVEAGFAGTRTRSERRKVVHPALGFRPAQKITSLNGAPVRWDAPIKHVPVNRLDGWKRGIPDAYASLAWARMYRDFLVDWAGLTKSLSKIAWKATGDTRSRAAKAAAGATTAAQLAVSNGQYGEAPAGQQVTTGPGINFEAVSKSGATIDSDSGKPLAGMVAAGMGVSLVALLADAGVTGARAVEQTLDKPTILEMGMRRLLWQSALEHILQHVIAASVEAPKGLLRGRVSIDDWGRKHTLLEGGQEPVLEFTWPPLADLDPIKLIAAIVDADSTGKMPPVETAKLLLKTLGIKDIDEVLEPFLDDEGQWIDQRATAGQAAADAFRRGDDPADTLA